MNEYVAPAPSSSSAAQAPVTKYVAPTPDVTRAAPAPFTDFVAPAPVFEYIAPARVHQELIVAQNIVAPVQYAAPTTTGTGVDVNRDGTPDVLQQPQFSLAPRGFAAPVEYGAPVSMGTMTVTGADMNRDGSPDVLQQPQIGIAHKGFAAPVQYGAAVCTRRRARRYAAPVTEQPHHPRKGDLTMEERDRLMALLIALGDEIYYRGEDPELGELVGQLMDRLLEADTSEIADDARETTLHQIWCGTAGRFNLTIDDSDEDVSDEDDGIAALIRGTPCRYTVATMCRAWPRTSLRRCGQESRVRLSVC